MKSGISITLLLLYITYTLRSILPYLEYSINYDFISEELCINLDDDLSSCKGKCYLNTQIKLFVGDQDSNQGIPLESRTDVKNLSHTLFNELMTNQISTLVESEFVIYRSNLRYDVILELVTPPPKSIG